MTTETESAKPDPEAKEIADEITESQADPPETETPPEPAGPTLADLQENLTGMERRLQGRTANYVSDQLKVNQEDTRKQIEELRSDLRGQDEYRRATDAGPEAELDYLRSHRDKPEPQPESQPEPTQPQQATSEWTNLPAAEGQRLGDYARGLLEANGLDPNLVGDNRLWAGANSQMGYTDLAAIAKKNAPGLKPAPKAASEPTPKADPPPSTQGSPTGRVSDYETKSELVQAFTNREINSDQYRTRLAEINSR